MKTNFVRRLLPLALVAAFGLRASAAVLNFDSDTDGSGNDCSTGAGLSGGGIWDATSLNWADSTDCTTDIAWVNGSDAVFWGGSATVTASSPFTVSNITFQSSALTLSGSSTLTLSGTPTLTANNGLATISAPIGGTAGYNVGGTGRLKLSNNPNLVSGPMSIGTGSTLELLTGASMASSGSVTINGGTLRNDDDGSQNGLVFYPNGYTGNIVLDPVNGGTIAMGGTLVSLSAPLSGLLQWPNGGNCQIQGGPLTVSAPNNGKQTLRMQTSNSVSKLIVVGPACFQITTTGTNDGGACGAYPASFTADAILLKDKAMLQANDPIFSAKLQVTSIHTNRGITLGTSAGDNCYFSGSTVNSSATQDFWLNSQITGPGNLNFGYTNTTTATSYFNEPTSGATGVNIHLNHVNNYTGSTIVNMSFNEVEVAGALPSTSPIYWPGTKSDHTFQGLLINADTTAPSITLTNGAASGYRLTVNKVGVTFTLNQNVNTGFGGNIGGPGTFIKQGTGNLTNLYTVASWGSTGPFKINNGAIVNGSAASGLPNTSLIDIGPAGTMDMNNFTDTIGGLNGAGNVINATNLFLIGMNNTSGAATTTNFTGNISAGPGGNLLLNIQTISGTSLTQTLSGSNNPSSVFMFGSPTLIVGSNNAVGQGTILISNLPAISTVGDITLGNNIVITNGGGTNFQLTAMGGVGGSLTLNGVISGTGALKTGSGSSLTLTANNTFSAGVSNAAGVLNISHAHALGTGLYTPMGGILENTAGSDLIVTNPVTVQSGGFYYGGTNNNLTFSQPVNLNAASRNTRVFGTHSWIFAAGATSSGGAINKDQGVGTLQLQGTSTFTGSMTVSAGTLQVDGTASSSSGTTVNSGGTLIGSGTVSTVTLNSGGTISAGSGVGALNSGNQTWNGGSTNVWDFSDAAGSAGTGYDTFNMAGALTIGATPVNPMTLKITGTPANFPGSGSWTVATNTAVNNFDYRSIVIDTTALTATLNPNKAFRLAVVPGTGLVLTYGDPAITADATNSIVGHGTNAIFNVSAVGASLSYQWQKNGINISGGNITGETTSSLTVGNVSDSDLGSYSVIVTDSTIPASVTSASATLDIVDAPVITVQPASQTVGVNTNAQFIVIWNGSSDDIAKGYTKFQWRTNGVNLANTSRYQGVTTSNLTVVTAQLTNAASYTVVLSNLFGMVTNTAAVLGVDTIPTITLPPVGHIISPYGGWTNELVRAAGGDLSYRWWITNAVTTNALLEDPLNYIGTTATNLVITNAVDTNSGGYFAIVTNYAGSVTSAVAVVSIPVDPVVASSPASRSAVTGTTTVFTAVASGKPTLLYHWKKDGVNLVDDGTHVIGAHTASLTLTNLTTADTAITPGYVLEVTNDFDNPIPANTTPATLTVFDPIIIGATLANGNPGTTTYTNTNPINLTAPTTAGTGPFSYQWRKGAVNVGNGANITGSATSSMTIASAVLTNAGSYSLVVSNYAGAVTSSPQAVLVINQLPHITVEPVSVIVDVAGKTNTFTVVATGFPLNYQWYFNSNIIAGATSASYTIPSVSSANIGYYHVVVSNLMGSEKSDVVTLKIGQFFFFDALTNSSSAANWNIYTNRSDSTVTWGFDYSLHNDDFGPGIPQNPNSTNTTTALKLTINSSGTNNGSSMTLVPKTINATGDYQFSFDVFMNFLGGAGTPGSQTAQSMTAALGCVANITNGLSGTSNGVVAFANCDNALSADDYAMYENTSAGSGSSKAPLSDLVAGTGYHINSYYAFVSASNTVTFPTNEVHSLLDGSDSQTRPLPYDVGTFGLAWHHVLIQRSGSGTGTTTVTYYIDGKPVGTVTNAFFGNTANAINIGLLANFAGGGSTNWEFTLFNNIKVESFTNAGVAPTITTPVGNVTVNAGSAGIFTVTATNDPMAALRYQWAKGGVNLSNGGKISGATSSALTISGALAADAGSYTVTVLNDSDFVNGGTGVLTVIDPVITVQPTNTVVECSSNAVLSVTAAGTGPITYQWFTPDANGALVSGATASSLTITNANGSSSYAVVVTGNQGSVTSSVVTVSTVDTTGPDITVLGSNPATVECHTAYVEAGATANDGCVGNVNGSITISGTVLTNTVGNYTVTYSATDGTNPSSATRVVHVVDMTAPVVTLNPGANTVTQDTPYTDPGATSADTCSASLITHTLGTVDTSVAGHYTLTYTATDPSGNLGSALRAVSVIPVPVVITGGPTPTSSTNAQGTNFTLAVTTTGSHPLTYQWYTVEGSNAIVAGVTGASPTNFVAQPVLTPAVGDKFATNHYFVIVTGTGNSATSSVARVVIVLDTVHPTAPTVTSPIKNKGTTHVSLIGTAKDTKGDVAHVYYKYVNLNPGSAPSLTNGPINEAILAGTPASRTFTGSAQPLLPGTNNLMVWSVDLAGNISLTNTLQFFYAVPMQFTLNKLGDGSGTVAWKGLLKDKGLVQFGTNVQAQQIPLNVGETYTLTYTPDKAAGLSKGVLAGTNIVVSVLTNTAGLNPGTNSTIKIVDASFLLQSNQTSLNLEFDRNRFYDMAGTYNAVFTASPTPSVASARYLLLTVAAKGGLASGSMLHPDALKTKDTFTKIQFKPDGSVTITAGGVTVTGSLAWNGSEDTNAVKQFIGQATDGNWTAPVIADLADKTVLQTPGLATMQIPAVNGGPAGTGFATVKLAGGAVTATYTLADDDKDPASWKMTGSRSGRVPQFVVTKAGDVLLGTLNVNDGLTTIVGTNLTWMHPAGSVNPKYASMLTAGFTNSPFDAICSPFTPASVTGAFTLAINGGNVISNVNQVVNFTAGTVANTSLLTKSGHVSGGKIDATGKITITFLDGAPKSHPTTAVGVVLQNATNNGAGFFIFAPTTTFPTNSGTMTLTPQ